MKKYIKIASIIFALVPFFSNALVVNRSIGGEVGFNITPKNPGSFTNVKVSAISYEMDLNNAHIYWYINGSLEKEGVGRKEFSFQTGKNGSNTVVRGVFKGDGKEIEKTMSVNPADVDIVWEADTYVPPLYKGKAGASPKSTVKVVAVPFFLSEKGTRISPDDLTYEWFANSSRISKGYGKTSEKITMGSPFGDTKVSVIATNSKGDIVAEKEIKIKPEEPLIIFYEDKPADGTNYLNALNLQTNLSEREINIRAEPYFFSYPDTPTDKNLEFTWTMNEKGITPNEGTPKIITLRSESSEETTSLINVSIKNIKRLFQSTNNSLMVKSSPNLFKF